MKVHAKTVYISHLNYRVRFRPFKKPPSEIATAKAWTRRDHHSQCTVFVAANESPSSLAHELVHVLWFICKDRHMDFEREFEHTAYLMQYLMGQALGYVWASN